MTVYTHPFYQKHNKHVAHIIFLCAPASLCLILNGPLIKTSSHIQISPFLFQHILMTRQAEERSYHRLYVKN